ncbi:SPFH domain-containing protein [Parabacteroides sp. AD58]|uniref:SPFH domain-containing protein n=1 Tax=Parabacteroides absconsus TaxID=2951805 RepID=A0ABZ2IMZ5_9BACT|nr:SPFH domain-containing protein [Parabacteroides sp. AD58]MCM6903369.1 SPFH domain-containing protein [Parabacteroides sp. AD58]
MAIIDSVRWAPQGDETIYAWRYPETNLSTYTQLIVAESQEAVLFSKGRIIAKFGPGKHTLNTENIPILRSLYGLPFGGKNPFTAEVWFVNKLQPCNIEWTASSMSIHDVDYNTQLPLKVSGQYGLKVVDAEKFLIKIVGTKSQFTEYDLTEHFAGEFNTKSKSAIVQYMMNNRIGYKQISAFLDTISEYLKGVMSAFWNEYGLSLLKFYVTSIDIDDSTIEGRRIKDAISRQSSMSITGHTWQQEQIFDTANNAIGNLGSGNVGLLGGLLAMNMMSNMGGGMSSRMMQPQYNQPTFGGNQNQGSASGMSGPQPTMGGHAEKMVYCSNCAKKFPSTMKFCPHCGDPYNPCPHCGTDNDLNAKRCISCGAPLQSTESFCPYCNAPLTPGSSFCGNCGKQVITSDTCSRCGATFPPNAKFCPRCGNKRS